MTIDPRHKLAVYVKGCDSQRAAAEKLGISTSYLNDLLNNRRDLSERVLAQLGLTRRIEKRVIITKARTSDV